MFVVVASVVLVIIGICTMVAAALNEGTVAIGFVPIVLAIGLICGTSFYTQDIGETVVLLNWDGSIGGSSEQAGFHLKTPWQEPIAFDVRNNLINMYRNQEYTYDGGSANGAEITVNDASGAQANVDLQVNYSIDSSIAEYLYSEYGTQTNFTQNYVSQDVRSVAREVAGQFSTLTMLTDRGQFTRAVQDRLTEKWESIGLTVEQVSVQDIRYPDAITTAYSEAQAAEVEKSKAENEKATAEVVAETKAIEASGEAEANRILAESLNDQVLSQNYIDALKDIGANGNLVVVPEGSMPMISTSN